MAITLRSAREIEMLRKAGAVVADVLLKLQEMAKPGVTTGEMDKLSIEMARSVGAATLFKGVESPYARRPFPGAICASVNDQVVHGIPSPKVRLNDGDILSVDFGVKLDGYCGDSAVTMPIGNVSDEKQKLMDVTRRLLDIAIEKAAPGIKWSEIAGDMAACAKKAGFAVVEDFVGHGIGTEMHEDPKVPNFVNRELLRDDILLREGLVLAVEPMVNAGGKAVRVLRDGWTVVTKDKKCSAHFEHTIAIVKSGCEVLTLPSK
ncbi:MAG: type I methionyl aminopeptidase [Planctomycetes bacterium]|nr:type I methionyl aminopeptidase [Planctomycetota bacterium]